METATAATWMTSIAGAFPSALATLTARSVSENNANLPAFHGAGVSEEIVCAPCFRIHGHSQKAQVIAETMVVERAMVTQSVMSLFILSM